ncbi:hypothetical protein EV426DRAFT_667280 [Tirmania nivea]|nr:hypothetical protein EV426DRAFT_667280 [Tirmania nivea]
MSFSTFFNNPFTTFSSGYASSYSSIDSTYSTSSTGSSPQNSPTQRHGELETAMYSLLKPVTASRPVTGTVSTLLDTQPRPTIISHRNTVSTESTPNTKSYTTASLSLTKFLYAKLGGTAIAPSVTSSGTSTPRHSRSRSAGDVLDSESTVARSRESSVTGSRRQQWEQDRQKRHREQLRKLKEELEREGFYVPTEGFDDVSLAAGDSLYKHGRDTPRAIAEIVLGDEDGPYAADRRAGRRSSVMVPGEINKSTGPYIRAVRGWLACLPTLAYTAIRDSAPCAKCVIRGEDINTQDSTEYFHIYASESESIDAGDAPAEESAAEEWANSGRRCSGLEKQEAEGMHVAVAPPRCAVYMGYCMMHGAFFADTFSHAGSLQPPNNRPPTTHELPEEHQHSTLPAEAAKPEPLPLPVPGPVASAPVSHPPTPPLSLSGDEAKNTFSILPHAPTPPPAGENDLFDPFFAPPGIVIPPAGLPAFEAKAPLSASADNAIDKGKQKEPEAENVGPHIVEAIPDDKEIDALVGKVPVTEHLEEWNALDKDAGAEAAAAAGATAAAAKEKMVAKPEEEKEVHILPAAEEAPVPVTEAPIYVAPVQIAAPIPEQQKVEPRRLEDEAVTEVAKESVETVVSEIADAVETPVAPEPKEVEFPVATPAEPVVEPVVESVVEPVVESIVEPVIEPDVENPETEVIAPQPELKVDEVEVETVAPVEVVEAGPSAPQDPVIEEKQESQAPAVEKEEEVISVPQIIDTTPEEDISKAAPAHETVPEPTPKVESTVIEEQTPVKEDVTPAEDKTLESESQPPMTPPIERDLDLPVVSDVSPRIPTPPDAPGNPLDWDKLVEEICKTHENDDLVPKTEDVTGIPGVVAVGRTEMPKEETITILPIPQSTLPQDVIEDLTPAPVKYTPPAPLPPRKIEDEEKPRIPEITVEVSTSVPEPVQSSSPVKSDMPDLPEFGNQQPSEEQMRTRPRAPSSLISRPSLADIREEADLEDAELGVAELVVAAPAAREEPVVVPVITDVNPVDTVKLVQPEVMPAPPPVRNLNDEMADEIEEWVPKYKETGAVTPGDAAVEESEIRPATPPAKGPEAETATPLERVETHAPSAKEKSALRKLGRTFSFGSKKQPHMGDLRPGTSHSAAVSVASVDDDRRSMAESTKKSHFLNRNATKRMLTLGLAGKDKDKKKDNASVTDAEDVAGPAGKAHSIRSVTGATSPAIESPPATPVKRNARDIMKLAIGMKKKQQEAGADSVPASPIDGASSAPPHASPTPGRLNANNAVSLMMKKKRDQDAKVKSAEAAAAAAAAVASPPLTAVAPTAAETPAVESTPPASQAAAEIPAEEATAPSTPSAPRRRNTITMNNAVNLLLLRKKAKEDKAEAEKAAPSAPGTPGADDSAVAVEDDKPATPSGTEPPAEDATPPPPRRRNTLTLKGAAELMSFRKKVKGEKEEHEKVNGSSSDAAVDDSAVDTSAAEVSPPATPRRRTAMNVNNAVNLMLRKNKEKGKEKESDESSPDGDSSATPKKEKRMSMGSVFGRKKSSPNSPTIGASASRPLTPSTPAAETTASFVPPPLESANPGIGLAIDADSSKQASKAPSVNSVDQRPGTSASTRNFGFFKKRTPSVYSKDTPESPNPFNAPNSPFPPANGVERSGLNHPETSHAGEGEDVESNKRPKFGRRWTDALGARGKSSSKLANVEAPGSSGEQPKTPGTTATADRPTSSASISQGPVSPSKIPVPVSTVGTVPSTVPTAANGEKRPKLANRAKTFIAFNKKK